MAITTAFSQPVPASAATSRVSFNGGKGGTTARPTPAELAMARERHDPPTAAQVEHQNAASRIASLKYGANHGQPPIAALQRPSEFHGAHIGAAAIAGAAAAAAVATHGPQRFAAHGPATRQHFAYHAPAMRAATMHPHFAYHAPAMRPPAFHPNFAFHAPPMRMGSMGGMHFGGTPHFGGGGPHFGGVRIGGAPHMDGGGGHKLP